MAPEITGKMITVTPVVDIWAFGIMLYALTCGYFPTAMDSYKKGKTPVQFWKRDWRGYSESLQDFILQCTQIDPMARPSAEDLLKHPWLTQ